MHVEFAKRHTFALISPNDIIPQSPGFILMFSVSEGVPGSTALTGKQEGLWKDWVLGRY